MMENSQMELWHCHYVWMNICQLLSPLSCVCVTDGNWHPSYRTLMLPTLAEDWYDCFVSIGVEKPVLMKSSVCTGTWFQASGAIIRLLGIMFDWYYVWGQRRTGVIDTNSLCVGLAPTRCEAVWLYLKPILCVGLANTSHLYVTNVLLPLPSIHEEFLYLERYAGPSIDSDVGKKTMS